MKSAGGAGLGGGDHVVVAAVDAVHERDAIAGAVGQAQPQHMAVKLDGAQHAAAEQ
jgi:hypothetical protein